MTRPRVPVLFRAEDVAPSEFTAVGTGIRRRRPSRPRRPELLSQLLGGPFLAGFDGVGRLVDVADKDAHARLIEVDP